MAKKDRKQTWKLVNDLSSCKTSNAATVKEIKLPDKEVTNAFAIANAQCRSQNDNWGGGGRGTYSYIRVLLY